MFAKDITGHLVIVMAPMASGKGSLIAHAQCVYPQVVRLVSCTTRERRPEEREDIDYHFITREAFDEKIAQGEFLEWAEFSGNRYGTLRSELIELLQSGKVVVNEIDLQGVIQLLDLIPRDHITLIYIDAGDWETLKARALRRAPMTEEHLALRHERYLEEDAYKGNADFIIKNTDGAFEEAKEETCSIIGDIIKRVTKDI